MKNIFLLILSAFFEIFGCYSFWNYFRLHKSILWLIPGVVSLMVFSYLLTLITVESTGRTYAVYGGIYIAFSLIWLYVVEGIVPDLWDLLGACICVLGAFVILFVPR